MSENIRYTDEPLGRLTVVPDFLPRPEDLVFRDEGVKVTIALSKRSVEFLKNEARRYSLHARSLKQEPPDDLPANLLMAFGGPSRTRTVDPLMKSLFRTGSIEHHRAE